MGSTSRTVQRPASDTSAWRTARALAVVAAIAWVLSPPPAAANGDGPPRAWSSLDVRSLVTRLETADAPERARFARYALDALHAAYASELDAMIAERGRLLTRADAGWFEGTRAFADRLRDLARSVSPSSDVSIVVPETGPMVVVVDDGSAIVTGPRLGATAEFEARVLRGYCEQHGCDWSDHGEQADVSGAPPTDAIYGCALPSRQRTAPARWQDPVCETAAGELLTLASILRRQRRSGTVLDWDLLRIRPLGHGRPAYVTLNEQGEFLLAHLPVLEHHPGIVREALPWLRTRITAPR